MRPSVWLTIGTTVCKWDIVIPFDKLWEQYNRIIKDNGAIVLFGKEPFSGYLRISNVKMFKYDWVWKKDTKSNFPQAGFQPLNNLELISIFSKGYARNFPENSIKKNLIMKYNPQMTDGKKYTLPKYSNTTDIFKLNHKNGVYKHKERDTSKRYPFNILEFNTDKNKLHQTQKPVALLEYLIKTYTNENELVLDNTFGSCSTGIACINTNRNFIGIEKDEKYFEIGVNRVKENITENYTLEVIADEIR
jgi:DNA modification methylase